MALPAKSISAVIPTRGDVDVTEIVRRLKRYREIDTVTVVTGATPFNRYVIAATARHDVIYTQDDDCLTDIGPLLEAYDPGAGVIVNAMTREHAAQYSGRQTLIGFGAIFDKPLLAALDGWERDALFYRESDRIFATVNPHKTVFPRIEILPCAHAENRLWKQADHVTARMQMERRILQRTGIQG